ncbi:hypothetical protein [Paracoccus beibuensis]|uniref:hypothetical protein n=1 Tax=Paracoccus beibuensis TaxID=547602 RepID=UPI0022404700|nr:hypothetical protein [Paracoccus beibuensis]
MNMNQLFNMFTRLVARRAMNWGINKGINTLSGKKHGRGHHQNRQARDLARKMRVLSRLTRH